MATIFDGATSVGTVSITWYSGPFPETAQFLITGTATVKLQGSLNNVNWKDIVITSTSESFEEIPKFIHYQGNITSISSGSVSLWLV